MKCGQAERHPAVEDRRAVLPRLGADGGTPSESVVFVVDDEYFTRSGIRQMLEESGWRVEDFSACEAFLEAYSPRPQACLVLDMHFPGMGGLELLERLKVAAPALPTIVISGSSGISEAVESMKAGATDFLEKPVECRRLVDGVRRALRQALGSASHSATRAAAVDHLAELTPRQSEIMTLVLDGHPSKNIAADLGISRRTVENHRAAIMHKTGSKSLPALARLVLEASAGLQPTPV